MPQVRVAGVAHDQTGQHVLLIKPVDELPGAGSMLPIWIGELEATSILVAVQGAVAPRPLARRALPVRHPLRSLAHGGRQIRSQARSLEAQPAQRCARASVGVSARVVHCVFSRILLLYCKLYYL